MAGRAVVLFSAFRIGGTLVIMALTRSFQVRRWRLPACHSTVTVPIMITQAQSRPGEAAGDSRGGGGALGPGPAAITELGMI